ncbi:hypothetical protein BHYA_0224g00200 [Botrytis hyacinthi]|uniref:Uncharacterized protein n=1 Tax=Botrytis hyacinthi TaxID=278943 RepID=A0A4Z1GCU2_9HELO|nr:hypothetical protein BHYA_0224g00200 [Botrytis hyacinthi]
MSSLPPKASGPEFQSTEPTPAFDLLPTEIHLRIFAHYWSFGSLKFENAFGVRVIDVMMDMFHEVNLDDVRSEMALLYVNKKIHDRFEDFIYGQAELDLLFCIVHVIEPELKSWSAGEHWWKKLWPPSMLVDDVETQQRDNLGQLQRLTEVITTSFLSLELPSTGKLEIHLHANNSSSEDFEALMPIFHMNVALKTLLEVGYKERANFTIGGRDREGHRMNFENARGRYYMSIGETLHSNEPSEYISFENVQLKGKPISRQSTHVGDVWLIHY